MRTLTTAKSLLIFSTVLLISSWLISQNPQLQTKNADRFPTIVFTSVLWIADPSYYSIAVDSTGAATYLSAPNSIEKTGVPYTVEFQLTDRTLRIVFNVSRQRNFFAGDSGDPNLSPARSTVRTLTYKYSHFNNQFTYAAPPGPDIEELTSVFEELSETLEYGRKLAYLQQHDPNAIGSELQRLRMRAEHRNIRELPALIAILRGLALDKRLAAPVRSEAERLLQTAGRWR